LKQDSKQDSKLPPLREVIARYNLGAKKSLGQNFLLDLNLTDKIARSAGDMSDTTIFEVGPGPGGLTRALLDTDATKVIAIEKDTRCIEALEDVIAYADGRLEIIEGDALEIDLISLAPAPRAIIANLPYNIATPLLINWLKHIDEFKSLTLMFQKEVAERIVAKPRTKAYGRLSIIAQYLADVRISFDVPRSAFTPPPKVTSSIIHLTPREERDKDIKIDVLEKITAAAFGQRRKMLRRSLKSISPDIETILEDLDIAPTARAEELSIDDFVKLAKHFA